MFEVKESSGSRCSEVYYLCHCDQLISTLSHPNHTGVRQPYEMKTRQRWVLMIFIISVVLVLLTLWGSSSRSRPNAPLRITLDLDELTEREKCPACYGVNLCPPMVSGRIKLSDWSKYSITKLVNQKNIYFAEWDVDGVQNKLLLKKLAHDDELEQLDKAICERHGRAETCPVSDSVQYLIDEYSHHSELRPGEPSLHGAKIGTGSDVLLCPSHRKMDFLVTAASKFNKGQHKKTILANVLTTLLLNPEPLILQAFPASEGWPFPIYHGSCGRIVAEEYVGRRLTQFVDEPFSTRAYIAKQLLEMANLFSENPSNFVLYMTDPTPDNFAVHEDTHRVKMIDLENMIVVDKEELILSKVNDSGKLLVSQSQPCDGADNKSPGASEKVQCFSFSPDDLCKRPLTDHNYYAICHGLLAPGALAQDFTGGLLHSIPSKDANKLNQLTELLIQCKDPGLGSLNLNRVQAAQQLIDVLDNYLK